MARLRTLLTMVLYLAAVTIALVAAAAIIHAATH